MSDNKSNLPYPPKIREMIDETDDLIYISNVLRKRTKEYLKKLSFIQRTNKSEVVRKAAKDQYNILFHGGKLGIDKFITDLESSLRSIDRAVKFRLSTYARNAAILALAKATTTKSLAKQVKKLEDKRNRGEL